MAGRPRRTRIYGANYNIGESYYKPTLDNLNRKQFGSTKDDAVSFGIESQKRDVSSERPKSIFKRSLTEEPTFFDYHGRVATNAPLIDDDLDEDVQATLRKIREVKKASTYFQDDSNDLLDDHSKKRSLDVGRVLKSFYDSEDSDNIGMSKLQMKPTFSKSENVQSTSSASLRANATKERLANIESEMSERFEKQIQREKRSENLKKFLSETDIETTKSVKKVTF